MEWNIKNVQNEYANKKNEYDNIIKNFTDKKEVILFINILILCYFIITVLYYNLSFIILSYFIL